MVKYQVILKNAAFIELLNANKCNKLVNGKLQWSLLFGNSSIIVIGTKQLIFFADET